MRRNDGRSERYLIARITLGFFGAGVWVAGVVAGNRVVTGVAVAILLAAVTLGWVARYQENRDARANEDDEEDGDEPEEEGAASE